MTEREITEFTLQLIGQFFGVYLLYFLLIIAAGVMLALAVYNDARYRGNRNAVLWAVLSGFFGIAGLIYLIVQPAHSQRGTAVPGLRRGIPGGIPFFPAGVKGEAAQTPVPLFVPLHRLHGAGSAVGCGPDMVYV